MIVRPLSAVIQLVLWWLISFHLFDEPPIGGATAFVQRTPSRIPHHRRARATQLSMKIRVGIVGLPNIGKSTLFNALAQKSLAQAENFPFCTIEPNVAPICLPDPHLEPLGTLAHSDTVTPARLEFIDVAGLVKGASRGEGLGNKFLGTIRECDAICHVVRGFEDERVVHVDGRVAPVEDAEVVNLELLLADLAHVERRLERMTGDDVRQQAERVCLERLLPELQRGVPARRVRLSAEERLAIKSMGLLTLKPVIYVLNVDEVDFLLDHERVLQEADDLVSELNVDNDDAARDLVAVVSAKLEAEISTMEDAAKLEYLQSMGMDDDDDDNAANSLAFLEKLSYQTLPRMVQELLDLMLVYTGPGVPPERSRTTKAYLASATTPPTMLELAGRLHGDIRKGFIRAEVIPATNLLQHSSYNEAKDTGAVRTEGKDASLKHDDVVLIKWK